MKEKNKFKENVLKIVGNIPSGTFMTYKEVAVRAGAPGASRAVGTIMSKNFDPNIPCHRVIRSDGGMGGYNRGIANKIKILKEEGAIK